MVTASPTDDDAPAPRPARRAIVACRWVGALALVALAATAGIRIARQPLTAERRDGYVRDVSACGRKRACLMKPRVSLAPPRDSATLAATPSAARSRWSAAQYDVVRVWIAPGEGVAGWRPADRYLVRDAFQAWTAAGAPVRFTFVPDSARADVRVLWRDSLPEGRAGQATRFVDRRGWLHAATVEMMVQRPGGAAMRPSTVRSVALHEVGHLLGLEHSADEGDIMAAWVTARSLTSRDLSAMRTLYGVAPPPIDVARELDRAEGGGGAPGHAAGIPSGARSR